MPDVALLSADHRAVEGLFQQFARSHDPEIARQICDELTIHPLSRRSWFFDPLIATKVGTRLADEARHEHPEAKNLITKIEAGLAAEGDVGPVVRGLEQAVRHHVQEEESEIFPAMRDKRSGMVADMGDDVLQRKKELTQQMEQVRREGQSSAVVGHKLM